MRPLPLDPNDFHEGQRVSATDREPACSPASNRPASAPSATAQPSPGPACRPMPVFIGDVIPTAIANAEAACEVPQGPAPASSLELRQRVVHPRQGEAVGCLVVDPEFADHHAHALGLELFQGLISSRAMVARTTYLPSFFLSGQTGSGQLSSPVRPGCFVVGERHWVIVVQGRRHIQSDQLGRRRGRPTPAVADDQTLRVFRPDRFGNSHDCGAVVGRFDFVVRLIERIETDQVVGYALIARREA